MTRNPELARQAVEIQGVRQRQARVAVFKMRVRYQVVGTGSARTVRIGT